MGGSCYSGLRQQGRKYWGENLGVGVAGRKLHRSVALVVINAQGSCGGAHAGRQRHSFAVVVIWEEGSTAGRRDVLGRRMQAGNGTGLVVIWKGRRQRGREERSFRMARADEQRHRFGGYLGGTEAARQGGEKF